MPSAVKATSSPATVNPNTTEGAIATGGTAAATMLPSTSRRTAHGSERLPTRHRSTAGIMTSVPGATSAPTPLTTRRVSSSDTR